MTIPDDRDGGSPRYMPAVPDPTLLSSQAIERATAQFQREITGLRELHNKDLAVFRELLETRLSGMDLDRSRLWDRAGEIVREFEAGVITFRAEVERRDAAGRQLIEQRLTDLDRARLLATDQAKASEAAEREYVAAQIAIVQAVTTEKFAAVDGQFGAAATAVTAALSAAKEAVAEQNKANSAAIKVSEGNTKEQLTSLGQVSSANFKALEDKISDARDRITAIESITRGIEQAGGKGTSAARFEESQRRALIASVISALAVLVSIASVIILVTRGLPAGRAARFPQDPATWPRSAGRSAGHGAAPDAAAPARRPGRSRAAAARLRCSPSSSRHGGTAEACPRRGPVPAAPWSRPAAARPACATRSP